MSLWKKVKIAWGVAIGDSTAITDLLLGWLNSLLGKIRDKERMKEIATLVAQIAGCLNAIASLVKTRPGLVLAVQDTADVVVATAGAVEDACLTVDEIDGIGAKVRDAVVSWKEVRKEV